MFGPSVLLAFLAFLCAAQAQETEEARILREMYKIKCRQAYPDILEPDVYLHDSSWFCMFYCAGYDNEDNYKFYLLNKDDSLPCSENVWTKEPSSCLNGTCALSSSIETCKGEVQGELEGVDGKQCALTCRDDQGNAVETNKPEGGSCMLESNPWRPATCTSYGYCEAEMNYIEDSEDPDSTNDLIAQVVCSRSHYENAFAYRTNPRETCEYVCYFNDTGDYDYEFIDFPNGYACGDSDTCLAGGCRKSTDIETCNEALGENELQRIDFKECKMTCVGKTLKDDKNMPVDEECTKLLHGWYPAQGTCDDSGECNIDEEQYKDFFKK